VRIYLDLCCFNRPFDDQGQVRVRLEAEAKLDIQDRICREEVELAWSYILDHENDANPFEERREAVAAWRHRAVADIDETPEILARAHDMTEKGIRPKDALHVACAIAAGCQYVLTTDDALVRKARGLRGIRVVSPLDFIRETSP